MPVLEYSFQGNNSGLVSSANSSISVIENLTNAVNNANVSLQFKNGIAALDTLGQKLLIAQGNATLFGDSVSNTTHKISAYQTAINSLLANGYDPMDGDVQRLKKHIDELNASIEATPRRTISIQGDQTPKDSIYNPELTGAVGGNPEFISALNAQLKEGTITAQEYAQALAGANSTANTLGQTTQQTAEQIQAADGYIIGLKQALSELNAIRLTAPEQDLAALNAEIQQVEISLQQATNIGKVGFDELGNKIKGVSLQNVNGQLIGLSNNLFGARQIAKDVVRTLDSSNLAGVAKGIGLLAVDFLYYAQNAQFAAGATTVATGAIATEGTVAATAGINTAALGAAFASLLTPVNLVILGVAVLGGGLMAYEKHQKDAGKAATEHLKALREQKQALEDVLTTLSAEQQVEAKAPEIYNEQISKLNELYTALEQQIGAGHDYTKQLTDLQNAFPQFFANIDTTTSKTNDLTTAYKNAKTAIEALGAVTAANQLSGQANVDAVKNQVAANSLIPQLNTARRELAALEDELKRLPASALSFGGGSQIVEAINSKKGEINGLLDQIGKYNDAVAVAKKQVADFNQIAVNNQQAADAGKNSGLINSLEKQLSHLKEIEPYLKTQEQVNKNIAEQKAIQAQLDAIEGKNAASLLKSKQEELSIQQQIADIVAKSGADATKSGLTGYALQVAEITSKYAEFGVQLDKIAQKIKNNADSFKTSNGRKGENPDQVSKDNASLDSARGILSLNEAKQLSDAQIKEAQNTADAITKINNDFGIKQASGYNEELNRVKRLYDSTIALAQTEALTMDQIEANRKANILRADGDKKLLDDAETNYNTQIQQAKDAQVKIAAAKAALLPAIQAVDEKYIQQEQQTYDKIVDIANQALTILHSGEESRTDKINTEWQKRISSANAYFDKLRELAVSSKLPQSAIDNIGSVQSQVKVLLDAANFEQVSEEISKNFASAMQSAVNGFVGNFYNAITSLGATRQSIDEKYAEQIQKQEAAYTESKLKDDGKISQAQNDAAIAQINKIKELEKQATLSFGSIFSDLVKKFNASFNESILQSFTKQFTENLGKTLIAPTEKQLSISPEEKSAQKVGDMLESAGKSLADEIRQAGVDFYNKSLSGVSISPALLSGASGGSIGNLPLLNSLGSGSLSKDIDGGLKFSDTLNNSSSLLGNTFDKSANTTIDAANEAGKTTTDAANHFSNKIAGAAAALSLAGGLVSGATSPTSKTGQAVGGLLQGAGEGALIGSAFGPEGTVIGAIGGALIGGISGIFSASKAQKELQQQQLEQQQQQTALLKASLAYTSQIIGMDTANGIVTNVSVGATGQLVATVSGRDLQFILDLNGKVR